MEENTSNYIQNILTSLHPWIYKIIIIIILIILFIIIFFKQQYYNPSNLHIQWDPTLLSNGQIIRLKNILPTSCDIYFFDNISQEVILICPSFINNITYHQNIILNIYKLGYKIYIFDYPGFGNNLLIKNEKNILNYSKLVLNYILKIHPKLYITLMGIQFGSVIATYLNTEYKLQKLIYINPIISAKKYIVNKYPFLKYIKYIFYEYDISKYLLLSQNTQILCIFSQDSLFKRESPLSTHLLEVNHNYIKKIHTDVDILKNTISKNNSKINRHSRCPHQGKPVEIKGIHFTDNQDTIDWKIIIKFINEKLK